jgi:LysM repeat protein
MDNNDSNIRSQQTGGLKLMTVFIAVLALHVVVIGGFTVYHLMSGGSTDSDLTSGDKNHKGMNASSIADSTTSDSPSTAPTEVANIPAAPSISTPAVTPTPDVSAPTVATIPTPALTSTPPAAPVPAPAEKPASPATLATPVLAPTLAPPAEVADRGAQMATGPIPADLAPPPEPAPMTSVAPAPTPAPVPVPSLAAGPVHMPPAGTSSEASHKEHSHGQIYVVKITDSYKKIARKHHVTVAQLKEANHIHGDVLHTGQKLVIPSTGGLVAESGATSTLDSAPTVLSGSASPMTTGLTSSSSTLATTGLHHHVYTVAKGDTLTRIAHRFHTTSSAIMAENGITKATKLSIGKKLKIPSEESRSARNVTPTPAQPSQVQAKENGNGPKAQLANFAQ